MVKLQFRVIRKPYKKGKQIYEYEEVTLNFPKDLHEILRCLRDRKLEIEGYKEGKKVHVILGEKENP